MSCSAFGCTKRPSKESTLQFFRFPLSDHARLKQWIMNVRRKNWTPSNSSRLCCTHFEEDQFFTDKKGKRRLKDTAVPTIFNFPPYLLKKKETTKATRIKTVEASTPGAANHEDCSKGGRKAGMDPRIKVPERLLLLATGGGALIIKDDDVRGSPEHKDSVTWTRMTTGEDGWSVHADVFTTLTAILLPHTHSARTVAPPKD